MSSGYYEIVFPKLDIVLEVKSQAFSIFGIGIQWYGILITLGMILAMIFGFSQFKKYGINSDRAIDCVIGGIIGGIIGARAYYVIMEWDNYAGNLKEIINIRNGGLAIYGGVIGSILAGGIIAKIRKVKLLPLLDVAGMSFLIGQGIGRWGNFTNHEAFGSNTESIFGMTSGKIQERIMYMNNPSVSPDLPVHPCFLYESVWCLTGFVLLYFLSKKRKYDGQMFIMYIGWYGFGRFFIEGLRTDSLMLGNLRVSQVLALICFITSVILLIVIGGKVKRMGEDYVFYKDTEESKQLLAESAESSKKKKSAEKTENKQEEKADNSEEKQEEISENIENKQD